MSTIELDPRSMQLLNDAEFRLFALAGEPPFEVCDSPQATRREEIFVPVSAAAPSPEPFAAFRPRPPRGSGRMLLPEEREQFLSSAFPRDV